MTASDTNISCGLDRIHGLMAWWGMEKLVGTGQAKQYEVPVVDLVRHFEAASANQVHAISVANERFARAFQDLLMARKPPELVSAQTSLVIALQESFAAQTKIWAELAQNVYACCSIMAHRVDVETAGRADRCEASGKQIEAERPNRRPPKLDPQSKLLDHAHG